MVKYIPNQGDIIYVDFNPTIGHEQAGKKPAMVVSNNIFNMHTGMAIVCTITSNEKDYPTHYKLNDSIKIHGCVLCEHIKSIDISSRNIKFVEHSSRNDLLSVIMLLESCIEN